MFWWTLRQLRSDDEEKRLEAIRKAGTARDARFVEHLLPLLSDSDFGIRAAAAQALGQIGDGRGVEPLSAALLDASASVRQAAAESLEATGDRRAVRPLIAALEDRDRGVRQAAARALKGMATEESRQALAVCLSDEPELINLPAPKITAPPLEDPHTQLTAGRVILIASAILVAILVMIAIDGLAAKHGSGFAVSRLAYVLVLLFGTVAFLWRSLGKYPESCRKCGQEHVYSGFEKNKRAQVMCSGCGSVWRLEKL